MARPRKDLADPTALKRIEDSFWELLEENDLKRITVNMVTEKAGCNRGTFYYYFDSMDALLSHLVERDILSPGGLTRDLFSLLVNSEYSVELLSQKMPVRMQRFGLLLQRAGEQRVGNQAKRTLLQMWEGILCPREDDELTEASRVTIEYGIGGIISVIDYLYSENKLDGGVFSEKAAELLQNHARYMLRRLSEAQGVSIEELQTRFAVFLKALDSQ